MIKEITLQDLLPNEFYINKEGNMVAEISLKRINNIASVINNLYDENKKLNNIIKKINIIQFDDNFSHIEKLQKINKLLGSDK